MLSREEEEENAFAMMPLIMRQNRVKIALKYEEENALAMMPLIIENASTHCAPHPVHPLLPI